MSNNRPTPETDAMDVSADMRPYQIRWHSYQSLCRKLERQRDEALDLVKELKSELTGAIFD